MLVVVRVDAGMDLSAPSVGALAGVQDISVQDTGQL